MSFSEISVEDDFDEFDEDFDDSEEWCGTCNNMGYIDCDCGGDICVCENNGELPCPDCF